MTAIYMYMYTVSYFWIMLPALSHEVSKSWWAAARESGALQQGNKHNVVVTETKKVDIIKGVPLPGILILSRKESHSKRMPLNKSGK